ncbi:hypothetical protein FPHYL_9034 [Fusarium phyllophilum]|uniref:2EXR domain-containing protein n=1 Tax=Fusarium phyllophilum TaxID=47803 RepID=A0A8H5JBK7_9HYPO|nr:hypothetical protein FPHYL_9034 [Fusarium phyllophilum]
MCNSGTGISLPIVPHMNHLVAQKALAAATVTISPATARASPSRGTVHQVKAFTPEALLFALHHSSNFQLLTFDILHLTNFRLPYRLNFYQDSSSALVRHISNGYGIGVISLMVYSIMMQPMAVEDPDHGVGLKQTEKMPALSANEMSPMTFHRFRNLPTEVRLMVWKAACFPYAADQRGLHYIDLETVEKNLIDGVLIIDIGSMEMKALHPDFQTSPNEQRVVGCAKRSAYMWDAGLWKACRESRDVIFMHFQLNIWRGPQGKDIDPLELDECLSKACRPYFEDRASGSDEELYEMYEERPDHESSVHEREPFLHTCLVPHSQEHAERFMVMPTRDLFRIKNLSKSQLPVSIDSPRLHSRCPNGRKIVLLRAFNLVFEFDNSWLDDFPESWRELQKEESPRGLFASWVEDRMEGWGDAPCIYLLNKAARWGPHWWVKDDTVFHDCDNAYVEVDNNYFGFYPGKPAEASAMLQFLWHVWALRNVAFCRECTHDEICMMCNHDPSFDMTGFVKVLVRHEVEPARGQIEDRVDELGELENGNDCEIEHESEDGKEGQEASES